MKKRIQKFFKVMLVASMATVFIAACNEDDDSSDIGLTGVSKTYTLNSVSNPAISGTVKFAERDELKRAIYDSIRRTVELEDAFVDLAYAMGPVEGVTAAEIKAYIRYIADRRAIEMGLRTVFGVKSNPLPWVDSMISGVEHTNFFENRPTQYAKASSTGKWEDAYADLFPEAEVSIAA